MSGGPGAVRRCADRAGRSLARRSRGPRGRRRARRPLGGGAQPVALPRPTTPDLSGRRVLFVHGLRDRVASPSRAERWSASCRARTDVQLRRHTGRQARDGPPRPRLRPVRRGVHRGGPGRPSRATGPVARVLAGESWVTVSLGSNRSRPPPPGSGRAGRPSRRTCRGPRRSRRSTRRARTPPGSRAPSAVNVTPRVEGCAGSIASQNVCA